MKYKKIINVLLFSVLVLLSGSFCIQKFVETKSAAALQKPVGKSREITENLEKEETTFNEKSEMLGKIYFHSTLNLKKKKAVITWNAVEGASKYVITCSVRKKGGAFQKIGEKTVKAGKDTVYKNSISYGKEYLYEVAVYRNINGEDVFCGPVNGGEKLIVTCEAPSVSWKETDRFSKKEKRDFVELPFYFEDHSFVPDGIEIYRGTSKKNLSQLAYVNVKTKKGKLQKYQDKTAKKDTAYFYRIRTYVLKQGKRKYGKFSDIREFSTDNTWGKCKAEVSAGKGKTTSAVQIVLTSQKGNGIINFGKKLLNKKYMALFAFDDERIMDSLELGLNEISYKYKKSESYTVLSDAKTISLKPEQKLYIRFARKDHKKFANPLQSANEMYIYMFSYHGHKSILRICMIDGEWKAYVQWGSRSDIGW